MAVIGTFGTFTTARLALYASQGSLNVTGNNIANINTKGYTRQRMDLVSLNATGQAKYANSFMVDVGYGVLCDRTSQLRDPFLDIRYRDKNSQLGQVEQWQSGLDELASILDEVNRGKDDFGVIENQLGDFLTQMQNLLTRVGTDEYDDLVRSSADTLCKLFNTASKDLDKIQTGREELLKEQVTKANGLLTEIRDLNKQIREHSIYGDSALELRDARNLALDELSSLMHINVEYSMEKLDQYTEVEKLTVTLADSGNPPLKLVDGVFGTQMRVTPVPEENLNPNRDISQPNSPANPWYLDDAGNPVADKWYLDEQGQPTLDATDANMVDNDKYLMELAPLTDENGRYMIGKDGKEITNVEPIGDTVMTGGIQAIRELLTEEGVFASADDIAMDPNANIKRGIPYYAKALDALAYTFAKVMNEANQMDPAVVYRTDANGVFVDEQNQPILFTIDGNQTQITADDLKDLDEGELAKYLEALREDGVLSEEYDFYDGGVLFSNRSDNNDPTGITAANISISDAWAKRTVRVLNTKEPNKELDHTSRSDNIQHIITLFKETEHDFMPRYGQADAMSGKAFFKGDFQHFFTDISGTLAADGQITNAQYINYSTEALDLENSRQSVSGVDLNEEATSMIQFSKSYSAACRLMTTIDSMLDKLINGTAL